MKTILIVSLIGAAAIGLTIVAQPHTKVDVVLPAEPSFPPFSVVCDGNGHYAPTERHGIVIETGVTDDEAIAQYLADLLRLWWEHPEMVPPDGESYTGRDHPPAARRSEELHGDWKACTVRL